MTRYSRSVIPGRQGGEADDSASLDRVVFGSKKRPIAPPPSDKDYPDPMDMDVDEAGFLVDRSDSDRRKGGGERRKSADRRAQPGKRKSDFAPLREDGGYRADDSKRGPILLVGALVIVAVFGVVVWNAYREGVRTDDEATTPQLATAGSFKTPAREALPLPAEESAAVEVLEQLEGGGPPPVQDERPALPAAPVQTAQAAPAPSKVTAPPPAPLKSPAVAPPQQQAVVAPAPKPVVQSPAAPIVASAIVSPAAPIDLPKPSAVAAAPAPVVAAASAYKPVFSSGGSWMAQIAATGTEAGAVSEWDRRAKALPDLFSAAERSVVQADVNGKTVYRVRAGSFATKADATAFCEAFKAKGGNCLPAAK